MTSATSLLTGTQPVALGLCATETANATIAARIQARPTTCRYRRIDCVWWTNQGNGPPNGTTAGGWDTLTPASMDAATDAAAAAGNKIVFVVSYSPPWAGGNGTDGHNFPNDATNGYRDYANFVYLAAKRCEQRHPGTVIAWEIWNEPQNGFLNPISVSNYGNLLETTYKLCRTGVMLGRANRPALSSTVEIWSGGTGAAPAVGSPNRHLNWSRTLLQRPNACCDAISIHMYSGGCPLGTNNNYDPATNDVPGIHTAIQASSWAPDGMQIHDTESGYFWRNDGTPTANNAANCNSYGSGSAAAQVEVTVSTAATRIAQRWTWWSAHAAQYNLGLSFYYQQDTTAQNNVSLGDGLNHAGLYQYSANKNGDPTPDADGNPALVDAFNAINSTSTNLPAITFPLYAATGAPAFGNSDVDNAIGRKVRGFRAGFIDWDSSDPTFSGNYTPLARDIALIKHMADNDFGFILQVSLGQTFGGIGGANPEPGQGYNHAAAKPGGGTVNVPVQLAKFIVNVGKYYDGRDANHPLVTQLEILNEVNHFKFDSGVESGVAANQKGAAYLEYLARIYPPLKAARPDLKIITSGLGGHEDNDGDRDAFLFTKDLWAASITISAHTYSLATDTLFDFYCFHPYFYYGHHTDPNSGWVNMVTTHDWIATQPGYADVKFYVTESGYPISLFTTGTHAGQPDGVHTLAESAAALTEMCIAWNGYPWGGGAGMPFTWFDNADGGASVGKGKAYGLLNSVNVPNNPRSSTFTAISNLQVANPPPTSLTFAPLSGAPAGGTTVTIGGSFFTGATVKIGGATATVVSVSSDGTQAVVTTPAHASGNAAIVLTTSHGAVTVGTFQYQGVFVSQPTVTAISPATGSYAGGTNVTVTGTHFDTVNAADLTSVQVGGTAVTALTVNSATSISCTVPAGMPGGVHLTVRNSAGTSLVTAADLFTYSSPKPVFQIVAVSLADGTVYTNFASPVNVRGQIAVAWSGVDALGIASTEVDLADGTFLEFGSAGFGVYGAAYDATQLPDGLTPIIASGTNTSGVDGVSPPVVLNIQNGSTGGGGGSTGGLFAEPFYTIYTIPGGVTVAPRVTVASVGPNPLTESDSVETIIWSADQDGDYVVSLGNATVDAGTVTAGTPVTTTINRTDFAVGSNDLTITVTNANGSGTATFSITRGDVIIIPPPPTPGLCWSAPILDTTPREEQWADPIANRFSRHLVQPEQQSNVFILRSGAIVTDYCPPDDPIRVSLFGSAKGQHVTQADADLLIAAGYGLNLVACPPPAGFDSSGWDTTIWDPEGSLEGFDHASFDQSLWDVFHG